ncbi:helix-turn-helix domain-containing protein [Leptospira sp. GIMC2001]|uniref:helix-turn-helix domain-containing protein n=1 Tax=Leptospira sp. GIMC2001 TaxID=1513297 RepID=UPI00234965E1|nr:hypothetical protein [Leptospira sp. GIMC2001]WCL51461.1 hypothetical protein O4O04_20305 [Leptospira sp. GIMC2001]
MRANQIQANKTEENSVMSPEEINKRLSEMNLTQTDLRIRTGLSYATINGTINKRMDSATLLSYLEDLGIKHNRPYKKELARHVIYPKTQNPLKSNQVA